MDNKDKIICLGRQFDSYNNMRDYLRIEFISMFVYYKSIYEFHYAGEMIVENYIVNNAIDLINTLDLEVLGKIKLISPTPHGSMRFMWINDRKDILFIEVGSTNYCSVFSMVDNNDNNSFFGEFDSFKISKEIYDIVMINF